MTRIPNIPIAFPTLCGNEINYVRDCLETGWISSIGPFIGRFEQAFADFCGVSHAVASNNGTSALHLALAASGVGPGDEVIVPTLTYVASANAVRYCGGNPRFVDSEADIMTLDPSLLEDAITERTKGIVAVHLYGHPVDMAPVLAVARKHGLFVIEDAAEAHGAYYHGQRVGSIGDVAAFSFYGNKIVSTGEGGMITTSDSALRDRILLLRGQGMDPARRYWFPIVGFNYRMTNIAAAIGLAQLEQISAFLKRRRVLASLYGQQLEDIGGYIQTPSERPWAKHAFWAYPVILGDAVRMSRDQLAEALEQDGIETRPVFYPMHTLPPYQGAIGTFPVAERLARRGLCLPMHCALTDDNISYIAGRLRHWCLQPAA